MYLLITIFLFELIVYYLASDITYNEYVVVTIYNKEMNNALILLNKYYD